MYIYTKQCKKSNDILLIRYCLETELLHRLNSIIKYLNVLNLVQKVVNSSKFSDILIW